MLEKFEKLLEEESCILIDSSIIGNLWTPNSSILTATTLKQIDISELNAFIQSLMRYAKALESEKIITIPEVVDEWVRLEKSFVRHANLMQRIINPYQTHTKKIGYHIPYKRAQTDFLFEEDAPAHPSPKHFRQKKKESSEQSNLFKDAIAHLKTIENRLNSHLLAVEDTQAYRNLTGAIVELSDVKCLKKVRLPIGKYVYSDLHTDEALVGAALYAAARNGKKITLATRDIDLYRLLAESFSLLCYTDSLYGNGQLVGKLHGNPIKLSMLFPRDWYVTTNDFSINYLRVYQDDKKETEYKGKVWQIIQRLLPVKVNYQPNPA